MIRTACVVLFALLAAVCAEAKAKVITGKGRQYICSLTEGGYRTDALPDLPESVSNLAPDINTKEVQGKWSATPSNERAETTDLLLKEVQAQELWNECVF